MADDALLQDVPLELKVLDYDIVSANDEVSTLRVLGLFSLTLRLADWACAIGFDLAAAQRIRRRRWLDFRLVSDL